MFRKGSEEKAQKGKVKRLENLEHIQFPSSRDRVAEVRASARNNQTAKKLNPSWAVLPLLKSGPRLWPGMSTAAFLQKGTPDPYLLLSCSSQLQLQILQEHHRVFPTLRVMLPQPGLELLGQDGQELLQHQQLQDLLLGVGLRL